jgi:hypothetical protein
MPTPLEKNMRSIHNADNQRADQTTSQTIPDCSKNNRQIVKTLKNIMQIMEMQRRKIVQQADGYDKKSQKRNPYVQGWFHRRKVIANFRHITSEMVAVTDERLSVLLWRTNLYLQTTA